MASRTRRWEVPPDPHHIGVVRGEVTAFAALAGVPPTVLSDLKVAVSDAVTSAVIRAEGDHHAGRVRVDAEALGDEIVVRVRDGERERAAAPVCPIAGPRLSMIAALAQRFGVRRCEG
ncbi:MAG: hypothetical protein QOG42_930, partial [Solirubrobacteraceae bacterium]|nr:hypothetical protein [Solirubrobacteraceae bacterium]